MLFQVIAIGRTVTKHICFKLSLKKSFLYATASSCSIGSLGTRCLTETKFCYFTSAGKWNNKTFGAEFWFSNLYVSIRKDQFVWSLFITTDPICNFCLFAFPLMLSNFESNSWIECWGMGNPGQEGEVFMCGVGNEICFTFTKHKGFKSREHRRDWHLYVLGGFWLRIFS